MVLRVVIQFIVIPLFFDDVLVQFLVFLLLYSVIFWSVVTQFVVIYYLEEEGWGGGGWGPHFLSVCGNWISENRENYRNSKGPFQFDVSLGGVVWGCSIHDFTADTWSKKKL